MTRQVAWGGWGVGVRGVGPMGREHAGGERGTYYIVVQRATGCIKALEWHATTPTTTLTRVAKHASWTACQPSLGPPLAGEVAYGCTTPAPQTSTQRAQPEANARGHKLNLP